MSGVYQSTADNPDKWEPAIPLPFYISRWFGLRKRYGCFGCAEFKTEREYEAHYRAQHIESRP